MTPEVEMKRRELYEAWAADTFYGGLDSPATTWNEERGIYEDAAHWMAWCAFNAALDAAEIHTPGKFEISDSPGSMAWNHCIDELARNIEATGLGLRIK